MKKALGFQGLGVNPGHSTERPGSRIGSPGLLPGNGSGREEAMKVKGARMTTEENRIVRLPEVMRLIGPSRATVHSCHHDGTFAERLRLASQST